MGLMRKIITPGGQIEKEELTLIGTDSPRITCAPAATAATTATAATLASANATLITQRVIN